MDNYAIVVDDDPGTSTPLAKVVRSHGYVVDVADSVQSAQTLFAAKKPNLMLVDVMLPDGNGIEMIKGLQADPSVKFVVITGQSSIKLAIDSMRAKAVDYLEKPIGLSDIRKTLDHIGTTFAETEGEANRGNRTQLIGHSEPMLALSHSIEKVARSTAGVWLSGESGTGKEIVARRIHELSERRGEFVAVNCGSISRELGTSELFGHERGSFTGAQKRQIGHFERAHGGTLLLDEITEMPLETQVYLLRTLEDSRVRRVGGGREIPVDVRVIAATNRDAKEAVVQGKLREDLYFRIAEFPIDIPALHERGDDIRLLAQNTLGILNRDQRSSKTFSENALTIMQAYRWPGNVRELKNVVHRSYLMADELIDAGNLPRELSDSDPSPTEPSVGELVGKTFWELEKDLLFATLAHHKGDKTKTAKTLGISLKTLYNRINAYS